MKHRDYVAQREASDPAFRKAREASRPQFEFRKALVRARIASGMTHAEIAEAAGVTPATIVRLETGERNPTLDMMMRLASALSVSFEIMPNTTIEIHEHE